MWAKIECMILSQNDKFCAHNITFRKVQGNFIYSDCLLTMPGYLTNYSKQRCVCPANMIVEGCPPSTLAGDYYEPGCKPTVLLISKYVYVPILGSTYLRGSNTPLHRLLVIILAQRKTF